MLGLKLSCFGEQFYMTQSISTLPYVFCRAGVRGYYWILCKFPWGNVAHSVHKRGAELQLKPRRINSASSHHHAFRPLGAKLRSILRALVGFPSAPSSWYSEVLYTSRHRGAIVHEPIKNVGCNINSNLATRSSDFQQRLEPLELRW